MKFRPPRLLGLATGVAIVVLGLALMALLTYRLVQASEIGLPVFGMGILILALLMIVCLFGLWSYGCWSLCYRLDRDGLTINWATTKHYIPLSHIKDIALGKALKSGVRIKGINWFCHHVGQGSVEGIGDTLFYSAHRSHNDLLYIVTPSLAYAISPSDSELFVQEVKLRQDLDPMREMQQSTIQWRLANLSLWGDRSILLLVGLILLVNASLFAFIFYNYPQLPDLLPLHFTALGEISRVGLKSEVLALPTGALLVLAANAILGVLLHAKERLAAYLCLAAALLVQVLFWVATVRIIDNALVT